MGKEGRDVQGLNVLDVLVVEAELRSKRRVAAAGA